MENLVGKIVKGTFKRPDRPSSQIAVEVTAHVTMPRADGSKAPYLFGTRLDIAQAGKVVLIRGDAFKPGTLTVEPSANFKPVDTADYFVTPPNRGGDFFAFIEKVAEQDRDWSVELGGHKLTDFIVEVK